MKRIRLYLLALVVSFGGEFYELSTCDTYRQARAYQKERARNAGMFASWQLR